MGAARVRKANGTYFGQPGYALSLERQDDFCSHGAEHRYICKACGPPPPIHSRTSVSYHEATHAVFHLIAGVNFTNVTATVHWQEATLTRPAQWVMGVVNNIPETLVNGRGFDLYWYMKGIVAGDVAQYRMGFLDPSTISEGDMMQLRGIIRQILPDGSEAEVRMSAAKARAALELEVENDFEKPGVWLAIETLAARLQEADFVSYAEVYEIAAANNLHVPKRHGTEARPLDSPTTTQPPATQAV